MARSGRSVPALWRAPSAETSGFCLLSFYLCTAARKPIEPQSAVPRRRSPQRSGKGGYRTARQCLASSGADGTAAPGNPKEANQPLSAPNGVFRGKAPESTFAEPAARCFGAQPSAARLLARRCPLFFDEKSGSPGGEIPLFPPGRNLLAPGRGVIAEP